HRDLTEAVSAKGFRFSLRDRLPKAVNVAAVTCVNALHDVRQRALARAACSNQGRHPLVDDLAVEVAANLGALTIAVHVRLAKADELEQRRLEIRIVVIVMHNRCSYGKYASGHQVM